MGDIGVIEKMISTKMDRKGIYEHVDWIKLA
jgi:hypothetical protein